MPLKSYKCRLFSFEGKLVKEFNTFQIAEEPEIIVWFDGHERKYFVRGYGRWDYNQRTAYPLETTQPQPLTQPQTIAPASAVSFTTSIMPETPEAT